MIKASTPNELLSKVERQDLYINLIKQLNKDFQMSNLDYEFEETILPENLQITLFQVLLKLINNQYDDYLNVLYRIDIQEKDLLKVRSENIEDSMAQVVFLILKREAQKVWLRKNFSSL